MELQRTQDICTLQIGMGWFPERAGNGLDRVFYALMRYLPEVGVRVNGLVVGSKNVERSSAYAVRAFAPDTAPLLERLLMLCKTIREAGNLGKYDVIASHFALYAFPVSKLLLSRAGSALVQFSQGQNPQADTRQRICSSAQRSRPRFPP